MHFQEIVDLMKSHPIVTIVAITVSSELIWKAILYMRKKTTAAKRKVHEVIMFNEKGGCCFVDHRETTSSENTNSFKCRNKFCTVMHTNRIAYEMDQAQFSIDVAMYTFTSLTLMNALDRSLRRGVVVRLISDYEMIYSSKSQIRSLVSAGAEVRCPDTDKMMHHKFCVIDGEERVKEILDLNNRMTVRPYCSILISGSVNWTRHGLGGNWENCILSSDNILTESFQEEFNRMWNVFELSDNTKMTQS